MLVSGWQQAITVLLAIIPGFVYQGMRSRFRGPIPDEREITVRLLRALALSGIFGLAYIAIFGSWITNHVTKPERIAENPRSYALIAFFLVFAVPSAIAFIVHTIASKGSNPDLTLLERLRIHNPTPTAWDFAAGRLESGFVRVFTKDGIWIGGYAGASSFLSGYPEPREIYLEDAWALNDAGEFTEPVTGTAGMWIRCDDAQLVQFLKPTDKQPEGTSGTTSTVVIRIEHSGQHSVVTQGEGAQN
ncbi:DUF6338 family protein [Prescottella defluvii]|nr:DUF6338 family protein [Prescottella defluvii]